MFRRAPEHTQSQVEALAVRVARLRSASAVRPPTTPLRPRPRRRRGGAVNRVLDAGRSNGASRPRSCPACGAARDAARASRADYGSLPSRTPCCLPQLLLGPLQRPAHILRRHPVPRSAGVQRCEQLLAARNDPGRLAEGSGWVVPNNSAQRHRAAGYLRREPSAPRPSRSRSTTQSNASTAMGRPRAAGEQQALAGEQRSHHLPARGHPP